MKSNPKVWTKALFSVMAALCGILWSGLSALAAESPVEVSAQLTENTVSVTGSVQEDTVTRIGVLILHRDADLDKPNSADIVYVNEYELGAEKDFAFSAKLPKADLQQYVLTIGGESGLLYQRLLDGSELPVSPDTTTGESSATTTASSQSESTSASSTTASTQENVTTGSLPSKTQTAVTPTEDADADQVQTGDPFPAAVLTMTAVLALAVLGATMVLKKKEGQSHE